MNKEIDYEIVASLSVDIGRYIKKTTEFFPKEKGELLKHLAAASVHMALFMRDVYADKEGHIEEASDFVDEFLKTCGCDKEIERRNTESA